MPSVDAYVWRTVRIRSKQTTKCTHLALHTGEPVKHHRAVASGNIINARLYEEGTNTQRDCSRQRQKMAKELL